MAERLLLVAVVGASNRRESLTGYGSGTPFLGKDEGIELQRLFDETEESEPSSVPHPCSFHFLVYLSNKVFSKWKNILKLFFFSFFFHLNCKYKNDG